MGLMFSALLVSGGVDVLMASLMSVLAFARFSMCDGEGEESGWDTEPFVVLKP
jgi:hypothetical protein